MGRSRELRREAKAAAKEIRRAEKIQAKLDAKTQARISELERDVRGADFLTARTRALSKLLAEFQFRVVGGREVVAEALIRSMKLNPTTGAFTIDGQALELAGPELIRSRFGGLLGTPPPNPLAEKSAKAEDLIDEGDLDLTLRIDPVSGRVVVGATSGVADLAAKRLGAALSREGWGDRLTAAPEQEATQERNLAAEELSRAMAKEVEDEESARSAALAHSFSATNFDGLDASSSQSDLNAACRAIGEALKRTHQ